MRPRACEARIVPALMQVRHLKMLRHHQRRSRPHGRGRALPSLAYFFEYILRSYIRKKERIFQDSENETSGGAIHRLVWCASNQLGNDLVVITDGYAIRLRFIVVPDILQICFARFKTSPRRPL